MKVQTYTILLTVAVDDELPSESSIECRLRAAMETYAAGPYDPVKSAHISVLFGNIVNPPHMARAFGMLDESLTEDELIALSKACRAKEEHEQLARRLDASILN